MMPKLEPKLVYMKHENLTEVSDKNVMSEYLKTLSCEDHENNEKGSGLEGVAEILRSEIDQLPKLTKKIINLKFWDELTDFEIAEVLRICVKRVRMLIKHTLEFLRQRIIYRLHKLNHSESGKVYAS